MFASQNKNRIRLYLCVGILVLFLAAFKFKSYIHYSTCAQHKAAASLCLILNEIPYNSIDACINYSRPNKKNKLLYHTVNAMLGRR